MQEIKVSAQLTADEYITAQRVMFLNMKSIRILLIIFAVLLAIGLFFSFIGGDWSFSLYYTLPLAAVLLTFLLMPLRIGKIYKRDPKLQASVTWTFHEKGFILETEFLRETFAWDEFSRWFIKKDCLFMINRANKQFARFLPLRIIESEAEKERLLEWVKAIGH